MKQIYISSESNLTPTVRELQICPRCGRKSLDYHSTADEILYECVFPACPYWSRKPRFQGEHTGLLAVAALGTLMLGLLICLPI